MGCTTILVGKHASYDGSTLMARNEDSGAGSFAPKKMIVVRPEEQVRHYVSVISKVEIDLPDDPLRYTAVPNALADEGIWGEAGINSRHVAMTETETITSNARVLGSDPLVKTGIGEEDLLTITLPYIRSAREGVLRLGKLLETYGTYEMNGIGFQDVDEIWWMETIGGHHWIAKRVPDNAYAVVPNQQGIDRLDLRDAFGEKKDNLCSDDLLSFIRAHHLDRRMTDLPLEEDTAFDVRAVFGSRDDADHTYNTPRAWTMEKFLNPTTYVWEGERADFRPNSDNLPWCLVPEKKITVEDIKYVLSDHFQGTEYDPYAHHGEASRRGQFRPIGVNRNNMLALTQIRPYMPGAYRDIQWIAMGSNVFNAMIPLYTAVEDMPAYLRDTGKEVSTDNCYWANRLLAVMADAHFQQCASPVERYQNRVHALAHEMLERSDRDLASGSTTCAQANQAMADMFQEATQEALQQVLFTASLGMKNAFARSDA